MAPRNCLFLDRQGEHAIASTPIETSTCSLGLSEPIGEAFFIDREKVFDPSGWLLKASDALKCLFLGRQREKATQTAVLASRNCLFLDRHGSKGNREYSHRDLQGFLGELWNSPFLDREREKAIASTPTEDFHRQARNKQNVRSEFVRL